MEAVIPSTVFDLANSAALLGWLVLLAWLFLPTRLQHRTRYWGFGMPLLLSMAYAASVLVYFSDSAGGFDSLENVTLLFNTPGMVMAGWIHYLAFDLFVGWCIALDSRWRGYSRWLVVPCFGFTFMFGPIGLLLYTAVHVGHKFAQAPSGEMR